MRRRCISHEVYLLTWLLMCVVAPPRAHPAEIGESDVSALVEAHITVHTVPSEERIHEMLESVPQAETEQTREWLLQGKTTETTVVCEFRGALSSAGPVREYSARIVSVTHAMIPEPPVEDGEDRDSRHWQRIAELVATGEARAKVGVDDRGRTRVAAGEGEPGRTARIRVEAFIAGLFPPLPDRGAPFEVGKEWSIEPAGDFVGPWGTIRCDRIRVWTSGRCEVELSGVYHYEGGQVSLAWILQGGPPAVTEYSEEEEYSDWQMTRQISRSVQVLEGGIPVGPVESLSEEEEKPPAPE